MPQLTNQVVIVTGANGGLGSVVLSHLTTLGATTVAQVRPGTSLAPRTATSTTSPQVAATLHETAVHETDLLDPEAANGLAEAALSLYGRLDGLVNCAGVQPVTPFGQITQADWQEVIDVNLGAANRLTQAAAQAMVTQVDSDPRNAGGGSIVHVASIEGSQPAPGHSHYAVSKAGLIMHAKAAAIELGSAGIRVNTVSPGLLERPGIEEDWPEGVARWTNRVPLGRLVDGLDVAKATAFLLSDDSSFITGTDLVVDGGVSACPTW